MSTTEILLEPSTTTFASDNFYLRIFPTLSPMLGVLIIITNIIIIITTGFILHNGKEPQTTYAFLGNVALSDLIVGVNILFTAFYPTQLRTEMICSVIIGFYISSALASMYSIMLIAIDRYLYILHGLKYMKYLTMARTRILILLIWALSLTLGFMPAMGYRNSTYKGGLCWYTLITPPTLVFIFTTVGLVPLIVILVLYTVILKKALSIIAERKASLKKIENLKTHILVLKANSSTDIESNGCLIRKFISKRFCKSEKEKLPPVYNPSKWKAIKIVLLTAGCFFCTWSPFFFATILYQLCNPSETPKYCDNLQILISSPLAILNICNSILNPIIYAWWHNGFRKSVKKIYRKLFRREINQY